MKKIFIIIALMAVMPSAIASFKNGNDLLSICEQRGTTALQGVECYSYVQGVFDSLVSPSGIGNIIDMQCYYETTLAGITPGQIARMTIKYLDDHPEELNKNAAELINFVMLSKLPPPTKCYYKK